LHTIQLIKGNFTSSSFARLCWSIVKQLGESSPGAWSQSAAQEVQRQARELSIDAGLDLHLSQIREELVSLVHVMESVKNLSRIRTVKDFDQLSARMQEVRQEVIAKQIPAKGDPWSDEREEQIEALGMVGLLNDVNIDQPVQSPQRPISRSVSQLSARQGKRERSITRRPEQGSQRDRSRQKDQGYG
jgi:hypothetical protein